MFIEWNDTYATRIDEIDGHHKKLIELLNRSYVLIMQEAEQTELSQLLDELIDYAGYHFAAEEHIMRQHHYSDLDRHVIAHFSFINSVLSFRKEMNQGRNYLSIEIFDFIKNWLLDHILKVDSEMSKAITL
jgi:hemerythrin-like metal-binding protein